MSFSTLLCTLPRCRNSILIQHKDGNTEHNHSSNLKLLGFLPTTKRNYHHLKGLSCGLVLKWKDYPILTRKELWEIRASGIVTDMDINRNHDMRKGKNGYEVKLLVHQAVAEAFL